MYFELRKERGYEGEEEKIWDEKLQELALDIYHGNVFTNRHCNSREELFRVFIPLDCLDPIVYAVVLSKIINNRVIIYERMSKALGMAINGLPCFPSFHMIEAENARKIERYLRTYQEAEDMMSTIIKNQRSDVVLKQVRKWALNIEDALEQLSDDRVNCDSEIMISLKKIYQFIEKELEEDEREPTET